MGSGVISRKGALSCGIACRLHRVPLRILGKIYIALYIVVAASGNDADELVLVCLAGLLHIVPHRYVHLDHYFALRFFVFSHLPH